MGSGDNPSAPFIRKENQMTDRKIYKYVLVVENSTDDFHESIDTLIAEGFLPHGNAGLTVWPHGTGNIFSQAMVLYASEKDSKLENMK